jgi:iodotyrosine deiodinase
VGGGGHRPYRPEPIPPQVGADRGERFYAHMNARRSVRAFSDAPVPRAMIETAIRAASTAPSGAHMQPWTFVAVSRPDIKRRIRVAAEAEEREFYEGDRTPDAWLDALQPIGTTWHKPFLEVAPWLVVVFAQRYGVLPDGSHRKHYYVQESVGIACGVFIAALHEMGLCTLTHTPSPMGFLSEILGRPANERPFILFPVGYPAAEATVPELTRKALDEIALFVED